MQETQARALGREDPLEEGMATHSNILAWRIPWTEEPGGLQSIGSQRVKHNRSNLARMQFKCRCFIKWAKPNKVTLKSLYFSLNSAF